MTEGKQIIDRQIQRHDKDFRRERSGRLIAYQVLAETHDARDDRISALRQQAVALGHDPQGPLPAREFPTFPYIFEWSEEDEFEVRPCRWAGGRRALWQPHKPGSGRIVFGHHIVRERRAVMEDLCTICGQAVDTTSILWINVDYTNASDPDEWDSLLRPLFHLECVRHALDGCPHLRAGFSGFAPYKGPIRKKLKGFSAEALREQYGISVQPGTMTACSAVYQIPSAEMDRLKAIAAGPSGYTWRDESAGGHVA